MVSVPSSKPIYQAINHLFNITLTSVSKRTLRPGGIGLAVGSPVRQTDHLGWGHDPIGGRLPTSGVPNPSNVGLLSFVSN